MIKLEKPSKEYFKQIIELKYNFLSNNDSDSNYYIIKHK